MSLLNAQEPVVTKGSDRRRVLTAYVKSLSWVALAAALALSFAIVTELVLLDFVHGNPHRTKANALATMAIFPPMFSMLATIGCVLVFGLPQTVQAGVHAFLARFGKAAVLVGTLLLLPFVAILTWYCWEYLTPTDMNLGINEGSDWQPYRHGITPERYAGALAAQAIVTCLSVLYCDPKIVSATRRTVVLCALLVAVVVGIGLGFRLAGSQYRFLSLDGTWSRVAMSVPSHSAFRRF